MQVGEIISRFEKKGLKLTAMKMTSPTLEHIQEHYADLSSKPFFTGLTEWFAGKPVVAMVWEGKDAFKYGRMLLGETNPADSAPGTIRGDFAVDLGRNICHGSDGVESAEKEIAHWFTPEEIAAWDHPQGAWIYE